MSMRTVSDQNHGWQFQIPVITPGGQVTEVTRHEKQGSLLAHAHSPDYFELYFELVSFTGSVPARSLIPKLQGQLKDQFSEVTFTEIRQGDLLGFSTTEFTFSSTEKTRRFIFVDGNKRTYRLIYNPLSPLNEIVLDSVRLE